MDEVLRAMNEENERLMKQSKDGWSESVGSLLKLYTKWVPVVTFPYT